MNLTVKILFVRMFGVALVVLVHLSPDPADGRLDAVVDDVLDLQLVLVVRVVLGQVPELLIKIFHQITNLGTCDAN